MKSTTEQLRSRGYATENDLLSLVNKDEAELIVEEAKRSLFQIRKRIHK